MEMDEDTAALLRVAGRRATHKSRQVWFERHFDADIMHHDAVDARQRPLPQ